MIDVDVLPVDAPFELDTGSARDRLVERVGSMPGFSVRSARKDEVGWQLSLQVRLATDRADPEAPARRRHRAIGVGVELRRLGDGPGPGVLAAEALESESVPASAEPQALFLRAIDTVMERLAVSAELSSADPAKLGEALAEGDDHARATAVQVIRERQMVELRPALEARMLADQTGPREVMQIAGALGSLQDPEAAGAIIDAISRHPELTVPLLFVLGELGGREAEAYLLTVEAGHERAPVRSAARDALDSLRK